MAPATTISDCRSTAQTGQGVGTELTGWNGDFSLHHSTLFGVSNQGTYYLLKKKFFLIKGRKRRGKILAKSSIFRQHHTLIAFPSHISDNLLKDQVPEKSALQLT